MEQSLTQMGYHLFIEFPKSLPFIVVPLRSKTTLEELLVAAAASHRLARLVVAIAGNLSAHVLTLLHAVGDVESVQKICTYRENEVY
jgi:hypothetical protein